MADATDTPPPGPPATSLHPPDPFSSDLPHADPVGSDPTVGRVLVVSKTHLDVGFTDLAAGVRQRYLDEFFPRALRTAAELRRRGGRERLRWTTGSWILTEALDAADPPRRRELASAIEQGDLNWHALPFTTHTEFCDRSLFEHGLSLSAGLDRRFGRETRAAKLTDVPGHTRGLVSVLADAGVDFLHIGVNPASAAPSVPQRFRWRDPAALGEPEIDVMYQHGGYGDVQIVTTRTETVAVVVDTTGDNLGPRDVDDVLRRWAVLQRRFPAAQIEAATLDDVAAIVGSARDPLPVVTNEIGDTWIHGVGSAPSKVAEFRALCRARRSWFDRGVAATDEPAVAAASTQLLLVAEHTWGLDQKTSWPYESDFSAPDLAAVMDRADTRRFEASWEEQRGYLDDFVDLLRAGGRADLAAEATQARASTVAAQPFVDDLRLLAPSTRGGVSAGYEFELGDDGSLISLVAPDGRPVASPANPLGALSVQTFDARDYERRFGTYNAGTSDQDRWWARWDNTKPGLESTEAVSRTWSPRLRRVWSGSRDSVAVVVAEVGFDVDGETDPVSVPGAACLTWRATLDPESGATALEADLSVFDVPAARWPEAWWWRFAPAGDPYGWRMEKLGELVDPAAVVDGGAEFLHCADRVVHQGSGTELVFIDTSLVGVGTPRLFDWRGSTDPADVEAGWNLCLFDNVWGTNFAMWADGSARFRVQLTSCR